MFLKLLIVNDGIDSFHVTVNHVRQYFQFEICMLLLFLNIKLKAILAGNSYNSWKVTDK